MTKREFLEELRKNLSGLPKEEMEDKLNFYEEMINDRMDEGKSEEEAVADIGTTDDAVREIAKQTKITTLVKEKIKPKRQIRTWEIVCLIIGFPLWFPLLLTMCLLLFVAYMLLWVLVITTYSIEIGFVSGFFGALVGGLCSLIAGEECLYLFGFSLLLFGIACLFIFVCIPATKITLKSTKNIFLGIKSKIIKSGGNKNE